MGSYLINRFILLFIVGGFKVYLFEIFGWGDFGCFNRFFLICGLNGVRDKYDVFYSLGKFEEKG